jgi:hypothetical protein
MTPLLHAAVIKSMSESAQLANTAWCMQASCLYRTRSRP